MVHQNSKEQAKQHGAPMGADEAEVVKKKTWLEALTFPNPKRNISQMECRE